MFNGGNEILQGKIFKEVSMCENDFNKFSINLEDNIGGLFFCNKCNNVHRPGPCQNLGINQSEFAKNKKEQVKFSTEEMIFEFLRKKNLEKKRLFSV